MKPLPTAEELLEECLISVDKTHLKEGHYFVIKEAMIEFAKMHVEAALKEASEKAYYRDFNEYVCRSEENKQSILNAYSLTNIK